jgi:hypothetical protein
MERRHLLHRFPVPAETLRAREHVSVTSVMKSPGKANSACRDTVDILISAEASSG